MAQQVDIFSEEIDNTKLIPNPSQSKPAGQNIPIATGRGKNWEHFKNVKKKKELYKIMPNIPGKTKDRNAEIDETPKKNMWQPVNPIPAIGGPDNTRQKEKQPLIKFEMERSNLKVVEGTPSSIQLNLDKSKGLVVEQAKVVPQPVPQNEAAKPAPVKPAPAKPAPLKPAPASTQAPKPAAPKPVLPTKQNKPQAPTVQGRMTASSFMNIQQQQQPAKNQMPQNYYSPKGPLNFTRGMAGIPKSFLTPAHQAQIQHQAPNVQATSTYPSSQTEQNQSFSQGPIWEATIQPQTPSWTSVQSGSRFDQLPNGQYISQDEQMYGQSGSTFGQGGSTFGQGGSTFGQGGSTIVQGGQTFVQSGTTSSFGQQVFVQTDSSMEQPKQQYSPSDAYSDMNLIEGNEESLDELPESQTPGSKRLSAFQRLGPVTQPKKPKLTINLLFNKEQAVREVVDQSDPDFDKYTPVHMRPDIQTSLDDTVMKFVSFWPWKKPISVRRTLTARDSKHVMQLELEQMEEHYDKEKSFFQVSVTGYPESWSKEDVLDAVLEGVKGKTLIPCFIEFSKTELKFLVIRNKAALVAIHKIGFIHRKQDVELRLSICFINISANQIDFIPRLILRKRLSMAMEGETEINLKQFTLASDVSHFIYFPLNRVTNQTELMLLQSSVPWEYLTKLVLSHNRITTLSGFDLPHYTPRLKHLDLSYNYLEGITVLLQWRYLPLNSLMLEGNPLCADYIEHERYTKALKMMFPGLKEVDGVKLPLHGDVPETKRNYSPPDATHVVSKVLEVLFPLLDAPPDERQLSEDLYDSNAVMTVTFMYKLRYGPIYKDYRALFSRARVMDEGEMDSIEGADAIAKIVHRWPVLEHDPLTFTVDVMYHTDTTTILRISGIVKVTAETLAEDEHLLSFTRTLVLHSLDAVEYKITNEMIYWDLPDKDSAREAFKKTTVRSKNLSLKLDTPPDAELKQNLVEIFMKLTDMERKPSERCLESKNWHLRNALEYFCKLLKLDDLGVLFE